MKRTILFDFEQGDLAMKNMIVDTDNGIEAIKNKVMKLLKTEKGSAKIYESIDYGIAKEMVVGREYYSHIKEVEQFFLDIKRKVLAIDGVKDILKWRRRVEEDKLVLEFTLDTKFGLLGDRMSV